MFITGKEAKRLISNYFRDRYKMIIPPEGMNWKYERIGGYDNEFMVSGLELGIDVFNDLPGGGDYEKDSQDSNSD
ncbi:MAG: hypothetical protein JRE23_08780 [Deltaproteobacteria bacterium]|nr:hypothetical protein [Deltaproteobacteria bacterium]